MACNFRYVVQQNLSISVPDCETLTEYNNRTGNTIEPAYYPGKEYIYIYGEYTTLNLYII